METEEVKEILATVKADTKLQIAGQFYNTLANQKTKLTFRKIFGDDVANLAMTHNRLMREAWRNREKRSFRKLANADIRQQTLALATVVANQRRLLKEGNFIDINIPYNSVDRYDLAMYLSNLQDALYATQYLPNLEDLYWEMVATYKDLFTKYFIDYDTETLYQISPCNEFKLTRGNPEWQEFKGKLPSAATLVERKLAEKMEDIWNEPFWKVHEKDLLNAQHSVYSSRARFIDFNISNKKLDVACSDFGPSCSCMSGKDEYEFHYTLDEENTHRFLTRLRIEYGLEKPLEDLLKEVFGYDDGTVRFVNFCKKQKVRTVLFSL